MSNNIVLGSMTYLSKLYITVRSGKNSAKYIMKPKKILHDFTLSGKMDGFSEIALFLKILIHCHKYTTCYNNGQKNLVKLQPEIEF